MWKLWSFLNLNLKPCLSPELHLAMAATSSDQEVLGVKCRTGGEDKAGLLLQSHN